MFKKKIQNRKGFTPPLRGAGFTSIELMIATMIGGIIMLGIGMTIADSHRGFNAMYDRVYSDVVTDGYIARKTFDSVIRRATRTRFLLDSGGNWLEAYYCQDPNTTIVDSYARFSEDTTTGTLNVEYGRLNPRETLSTNTVCGNVVGCVFFKGAGVSAQMILTLDNGSETITVVSSAVMHNQ